MAGSAAAVRGLLERYRLPGTVQYFGCPAEEIMLGKIVMAKQGAFDSSDVCLTWHPMAQQYGVRLFLFGDDLHEIYISRENRPCSRRA